MKSKIKHILIIIIVCILSSCSLDIFNINQNNGNTPLADNLKRTKLPEDFPKYTVSGQSPIDETIYVTPHHPKYTVGWLLELNSKGELQYFEKVNYKAFLYRHFYTKDNKERYAYLMATTFSKYADAGLDECYLVICDENHNIIKEKIRLLEYGNIKEGTPIDMHDYIIYDDDHYILIAAVPTYVDNIPGFENKNVFVFNNVIQEIKDGKVIYQWESIDHPELYEYSFRNNDYENSNERKAIDYSHINKIDRFSNGDYLVSFRHIGLIRFDYATGDIKWVIGHGHNDFEIDEDALPYIQHDSILLDDNTITIFDNALNDPTRILKYHIDEENMTIKADIYETNYPKSPFMGSSHLLKDDTYLINYGGDLKTICFEIYDFKNNEQLFLFNFESKDDIYAVTQGDYVFK